VKKSKQITLTLLSGLAVAASSCGPEEKELAPNDPYSEYSYVGRANEPGMVYSHYGNGLLTWYLVSRMFNGYGYGPMGGSSFYRSQPHYFTRTSSAKSGYASGVSRGGFGRMGYSASARS
jgi:hypothetical protein